MIAIISVKLLDYYETNKRILPWRESADPYKIWVSEIMLQQTRVGAVIPYYNRFLEEIDSIEKLATVEDEKLRKLWEGLGYYSRVMNMKRAAHVILEKHGGEMPKTYDDLITLPGIGPYTAGAIGSIAFGEAVPALDGNVLRIYSRLYRVAEEIDTPAGKKHIFALAQEDISRENPGAFNQALMDLGNEICLPKNPKCLLCPLRKECEAYKYGEVEDYPKRKPKPGKKSEKWTVLLLQRGDCYYIRKRGEKGLLAGFYEFPMLPGHLQEEDVKKYLLEENLFLESLKKLPAAQHIFTHKIWNMEGYLAEVESIVAKEETEEGLWVSREELLETYPIPAAFKIYKEEVSHEVDSRL